MNYSVSNNYLIKALEELEKNPGDEKALNNFVLELKVSNLLIPAFEEEDELVFETLISEDDGVVYLPLFTGEDEFKKHYADDSEYAPLDNEFEIYAGIVADEEIDGIVLDVEGKSFEIPRDIIDFAAEDYSISYDDMPLRSLDEIRKVFENTSNDELVAFINDEANAGDFERLMAELSYSNVMNLVVSADSLDEFAQDGVIKAEDVGGFNLCTLEDEESRHAIIFTGRDEAAKAIKDDGLNYYVQLTRVNELFEFVLRNDMDGVIINPFGEEFLIPRSEFLSQASGIAMIAEDAGFRNCLDYAFLL